MNYDELFNKLNAYLNGTDVETTSETISAYNLYKMLIEEFHDARNAFIGNSYIERINNNRRSKIFTFKEKLQARLKKQKLIVFIDKKCKDIVASSSSNACEATVWFEDDSHISIYRDFDSTDMYFKWDGNSEFLDMNFDILNEYFNTIEEFIKKTGLYINNYQIKSHESIQEFSDGFLRIKLKVTDRAGVSLDLFLEKFIDSDDVYNRKYYSKENLKDFLNNHEEELLKKIPIDIRTLEKFIRVIVEKNLKERKILKLN